MEKVGFQEGSCISILGPVEREIQVQFYKQAAKDGSVEAQFMVGECYTEGIGVEIDEEKAFQCYQKAAQNGSLEALYALGRCYYQGKGVERDEKKAVEYYQKAAQVGGGVGVFYILGKCYHQGSGVEIDEEKAVEYYQKAAQGGSVEDPVLLSTCYKNGRDEEMGGVQFYRWSADKGSVKAQFMLGECYKRGIGLESDEEKAVQFYQQAAQRGSVDAQFMLGVCYTKGIGVDVDDKKAFELYQLAAQCGDVEALRQLGTCYINGNGVERDEKKGFGFYEEATKRGNVNAMCCLGKCFQEGVGVKRDEEMAVELYQQAANSGNVSALFYLAVCYQCGIGVMRDEVIAVKLYKQAAELGSPLAKFFYAYHLDCVDIETKLECYLEAIQADDTPSVFSCLEHIQPRPIGVVDGKLHESSQYLVSGDAPNLGSGNFGVVSLHEWNDKVVAFKQLAFDPFLALLSSPWKKKKQQKAAVVEFIEEVKVLLFMKPHKYVHQALGFSLCPLGLITEYMENKDLHSLLASKDHHFNLKDRVRFMKQIAKGMKFLHDQRFLHRDLAARNVLVNSKMECKVSDFGMSKYVGHDAKLLERLGKNTTNSEETGEKEGNYGYSIKFGKGQLLPLRWLAPESVDFDTQIICFSFGSDVWSYGVTCWEIFMPGMCPYEVFHSVFDVSDYCALQKGQIHLRQPARCPVLLWENLLTQCLSLDASKRPNFESIIGFILSLDLDELEEPQIEENNTTSIQNTTREYQTVVCVERKTGENRNQLFSQPPVLYFILLSQFLSMKLVFWLLHNVIGKNKDAEYGTYRQVGYMTQNNGYRDVGYQPNSEHVDTEESVNGCGNYFFYNPDSSKY